MRASAITPTQWPLIAAAYVELRLIFAGHSGDFKYTIPALRLLGYRLNERSTHELEGILRGALPQLQELLYELEEELK